MGEDQVVAALLQRTLCDVQEPSFLGWTAFAKALSNVGGYGNRGPAHLMGQPKLLSIGKRFGESINCQHELIRLLAIPPDPGSSARLVVGSAYSWEAFTGVSFQVSDHTGGSHERLF